MGYVNPLEGLYISPRKSINKNYLLTISGSSNLNNRQDTWISIQNPMGKSPHRCFGNSRIKIQRSELLRTRLCWIQIWQGKVLGEKKSQHKSDGNHLLLRSFPKSTLDRSVFFQSSVSWAFKTDSEEVLLVERVTSKLNFMGDLSDLSVFKK